MSSQVESRAVYGKALGTTLLGLAGLAAQGALTSDAKAESLPIRVATSESAYKFHRPLDIAYPESNLGVTISSASADVDGDGLIDLAVHSPLGVSDQVRYMNCAIGKHIAKADLGARTTGVNGTHIEYNNDLLLATTAASGPRAGWDLKTNSKVLIDLDFSLVASGDAFPGQSMSRGVNVASGDINGDGVPEFIFGTSGDRQAQSPAISQVVVGSVETNPTGGQQLGNFKFFRPVEQFQGGIRVATGDVDGDGVADLVTTANLGDVTEVNIYVVKLMTEYSKFSSFTIPNPSGGDVDIAVGDVNGDQFAELAVSKHDYKSQIEILSWSSSSNNAPEGGVPVWSLINTLDIGPVGYTGGFNLVMADVTGDGKIDIIAAPASVVPEPTSIALIAATALGLKRRRRRLE